MNDEDKKIDVYTALEQARMHNQMSKSNICCQIDNAFEHAKKALDLSLLADDRNEEGIAYFNMGSFYLMKDEIKQCADLYKKALDLISDDNIQTRVNIYRQLSLIYTYTHSFKKANQYAHQALELATKHAMIPELCLIYNNIARIHLFLEEYAIADFYYKEAIDLSYKNKLTYIHCFLSTEYINNQLHVYNTNIEKDLLRVESFIEDRDNLFFLGPIKVLWAVYYFLSDADELAEHNLNLGLEILEDDEQDSCMLDAYMAVLHVLLYKEKYVLAEDLLLRAKTYFEKRNLVLNLPKLYLALSKLYSRKNDVKKYQIYLRKYVHIKEDLEHYLAMYF